MANAYRRLLALNLFITCCNLLQAQQRAIYFIDSLTRTPINAVEISELEQKQMHQTNSLGYFDATSVAGNHVLVAQSLGYAPKVFRLDTLSSTAVALQHSVVQLNEIRINAPGKPAELNKLAQIDVHLRPGLHCSPV